VLLLFSGLNAYEQTRIGFEKHRPRDDLRVLQRGVVLPIDRPIIAAALDDFEQKRIEFLEQTRDQIIFSNIILALLLTLLSWISLYFLLKPLADSIREKEVFLESASHELRTPLAIMYSNLSLSKNSTDITVLQATHQDSLFEIKRLQNVSDAILNRFQDTHKPTQIHLKSMIDRLWKKLGANPNAILFKNEVKTGVVVTYDTIQFEQLLFNILENAGKYVGSTSMITVYTLSTSLIIENETDQLTITPGVGIRVQHALAKNLGLTIAHTLENRTYKATISQFEFKK